MRADKRAWIYDGTITVASLRIWLRDLTHRSDRDQPATSGPIKAH